MHGSRSRDRSHGTPSHGGTESYNTELGSAIGRPPAYPPSPSTDDPVPAMPHVCAHVFFSPHVYTHAWTCLGACLGACQHAPVYIPPTHLEEHLCRSSSARSPSNIDAWCDSKRVIWMNRLGLSSKEAYLSRISRAIRHKVESGVRRDDKYYNTSLKKNVQLDAEGRYPIV